MRGERVSVLYRVSTDQQANSGLGLEAQRAAVAAQVAQEGWDIAHEVSEDGVSGKSPLAERTGLTRAMAIVASGQAEILLVAKLDRLSRDPLNMLIIEKTIADCDGRIVSCAGEGTASNDPAQVLMRRVMSAVAENEAAMISQRTRVALAAKKARGERIGRPPFGFQVRDDSRTGHKPELVPSPLFDELVACIRLLGYEGQPEGERRAWGNLKRNKPIGSNTGYMTQREVAQYLNKHHGDRTTWSHDKVGRISRRYDLQERADIVLQWNEWNKEKKRRLHNG